MTIGHLTLYDFYIKQKKLSSELIRCKQNSQMQCVEKRINRIVESMGSWNKFITVGMELAQFVRLSESHHAKHAIGSKIGP